MCDYPEALGPSTLNPRKREMRDRGDRPSDRGQISLVSQTERFATATMLIFCLSLYGGLVHM